MRRMVLLCVVAVSLAGLVPAVFQAQDVGQYASGVAPKHLKWNTPPGHFGLIAGYADDYLSKPFSMRELMARVKAQLRRTQVIRDEMEKIHAPEQTHKSLNFDNLVINLTRREVTLDDEILAMKPQEYDLLVFFAEHRGQMLSREFILERVWGWEYVGDSRTVDVHVRWLRQKIEKDPANPERIVTVRGGGYRFEG